MVPGLQKNLTAAEFVDATDLIDNIMMVKSDEEIELTRETCSLQDAESAPHRNPSDSAFVSEFSPTGEVVTE